MSPIRHISRAACSGYFSFSHCGYLNRSTRADTEKDLTNVHSQVLSNRALVQLVLATSNLFIQSKTDISTALHLTALFLLLRNSSACFFGSHLTSTSRALHPAFFVTANVSDHTNLSIQHPNPLPFLPKCDECIAKYCANELRAPSPPPPRFRSFRRIQLLSPLSSLKAKKPNNKNSRVTRSGNTRRRQSCNDI